MTHFLLQGFTANGKKEPSAGEHFSAGWQSPSNIALVKYWGKKEGQVPMNPSLSMTLEKAVTQTRVDASAGERCTGLISVNGDPHHSFLPRMQHLSALLMTEIPSLRALSFRVKTSSSFPHSTGIASSASGMSAFALCLLDVARQVAGMELRESSWSQVSSFVSRLGSGSACRSVYGGFAVWGKTPMIEESSDDFAVPVNAMVHSCFMSLRDAIIVVSARPKELSSSLGHRSMNGHPFLQGRLTQARQNMAGILGALASGDFEQFGAVAENEALSLHALIMSACPATILLQPGTLAVIQHVREARKKGLPLCFTLDAGANVHILYPGDEAAAVEPFINEVLSPYCEKSRVIFDACGNGPERLSANSEGLPE